MFFPPSAYKASTFELDPEVTPKIDEPAEKASPKTYKGNRHQCYVCGINFTEQDWMKDIYIRPAEEEWTVRLHLYCYNCYVK